MIANSNHPGWKLTRICIQDTLHGKRIGMLAYDSAVLGAKFYRALYPMSIRHLRETQLAPHNETKMIAGRYAMRLSAKGFEDEPCTACGSPIDPAIYIEKADNRFVNVLVDNDYYVCEECLLALLADLERNQPDMSIVYTNEDNGVIWVASPENGAKSFMVADYYRFAEGDEQERMHFLYALLYAYLPGMKRMEQTYPWFGVE